jgi:hypothetical protein
VSTGKVSVTGNKNVTLDLNGYGIRYSDTADSEVIQIESGSTLNIQGGDATKAHYVTLNNGRGTAVSGEKTSDAVAVSGGYLTGGTKSGIANAGTLSVSNVTILGNKTSENGGGVSNSGSVTMNSGSTWTLSADTYITSLSGDTSGLDLNGYSLYVNGILYTA